MDIKKKIQYTTLFSSEEKVNILANIDSYPQEIIEKLDDIINNYEMEMYATSKELQKNTLDTIDEITNSLEDQDPIKKDFQTLRDEFVRVLPDIDNIQKNKVQN